MAWNHIQSVSATVGSGNAAATYTTNLSSGSKLIALISVSSGSSSEIVSSVKDGAGNAMTQLIGFQLGTGFWTELWAMDTPAGDVGAKPTITATIGTNFGATILIQEVSGLLAGNTTAMIDGSVATNSGSSTGPATSGAYTSHASNEYLITSYADPGNSLTIGNPTTGYTADGANVNASSSATLMVGYKNSSNAAESSSFTITGGSGAWGVLLVAFKLAVSAAPTQFPQRQRFKARQTLQFPTPSGAVAVPAPVQVVPVPRERPRRAVWARVTGQAYVAVPAPPREPPQPRRKLARAVWRGSAPFLGYTAVPAPAQEYRTPPRRQLARAVWRSGQGVAYVAVPAPVQQPQPAPRRKPGRAVVEFVPVTTTNAAPAAVAVPAPPQSPYVAARRRPGRVLWHGGAGQAYVAVPAPVQEYRTPPRRRPARAQVRGGTGPAFAFVPAPRQQPGPAPRRRPARAQVRFVPVRTTNGAVVVAVAAPRQVGDYDGKTWWKKRWILRL